MFLLVIPSEVEGSLTIQLFVAIHHAPISASRKIPRLRPAAQHHASSLTASGGTCGLNATGSEPSKPTSIGSAASPREITDCGETLRVYLIVADLQFYVGLIDNLPGRIDAHNRGLVTSTKRRAPLELIYWEGCLNRRDAEQRKKYLKSAWGKRYLKTRLRHYLTG